LEEVLNTKEKKRLLLTGAARFNKSPKTGIAFLKEHGFVNETPESLAIFLKNTPRLDKRLLGDFISKPSNTDILNAFMALFDFNGVRYFCMVFITSIHGATETCCGIYARDAREFQITGRVATD
jgi:Sec7-like guanine-nucleotide exchange factor